MRWEEVASSHVCVATSLFLPSSLPRALVVVVCDPQEMKQKRRRRRR